jgi:hypothetical protein
MCFSKKKTCNFWGGCEIFFFSLWYDVCLKKSRKIRAFERCVNHNTILFQFKINDFFIFFWLVFFLVSGRPTFFFKHIRSLSQKISKIQGSWTVLEWAHNYFSYQNNRHIHHFSSALQLTRSTKLILQISIIFISKNQQKSGLSNAVSNTNVPGPSAEIMTPLWTSEKTCNFWNFSIFKKSKTFFFFSHYSSIFFVPTLSPLHCRKKGSLA